MNTNNEQYVIVNFARAKLHQQGHGHFSPIAAYNKKYRGWCTYDLNPPIINP